MSIIEKKVSANVIFADYPDPDVIRVENTYYMVSTTMHFMPGCVILRSYNLSDWEIASYVYTDLDLTEGQRLLDGKGVYGQGMWAASLRYHKGIFYVSFVANDTHKTYLYTSSSITGPWQKANISGFYHDMSILFDEDKIYVVSGNTEIHLTELESDLSGPKEGGLSKIIIKDTSKRILGYEGSHFYKINGKYYIFLIHWPEGEFRTEACYVSDTIEGPYKGFDILTSDLGNWCSGVAQGGIVDTPDGRWFAMLFQDHGALGRIPVLVPVDFKNDFPVFGVKEDGRQMAPQYLNVPDLNPDYKYKPLWNNYFLDENGALSQNWQWNHSPDLSLCSLSQNEFTIKTNRCVVNPCLSLNTLTQRPLTEKFAASVEVSAASLNEGDFAGLLALEGDYAFIGITKNNSRYELVMADRESEVFPYKIGSVDTASPKIIARKKLDSSTLRLKVDFDFSKEGQTAIFSYQSEEGEYQLFGEPKKLRFTLDHFTGCRFALFAYSTKTSGGTAVFRNVYREEI